MRAPSSLTYCICRDRTGIRYMYSTSLRTVPISSPFLRQRFVCRHVGYFCISRPWFPLLFLFIFAFFFRASSSLESLSLSVFLLPSRFRACFSRISTFLCLSVHSLEQNRVLFAGSVVLSLRIKRDI